MYDRCWFLGDDFGSKSFEQYFQARRSIEYNGYAKANFDTTGYFGNFATGCPNLLVRLNNLLVQGMYCNYNSKLLPLLKLIVIVPDDDILKLIPYSASLNQHDLTRAYSKLLNHVMQDMGHNVASFKEYMPAKSLKPNYPQFLWIQAPLHENFSNNEQCIKFNRSLEEVSKLHAHCYTLVLKRVWDPKNLNFFLKDSQRYTAEGLSTYWEAVDRTVRYFDSVLLKKQVKGKNLKSSSRC